MCSKPIYIYIGLLHITSPKTYCLFMIYMIYMRVRARAFLHACVCPSQHSACQTVIYKHCIWTRAWRPKKRCRFGVYPRCCISGLRILHDCQMKHRRRIMVNDIQFIEISISISIKHYIFLEVYCTLRPFLWTILGPYTNSLHATWGVRGISKPSNQSKDSVLWSRLEFGSTGHTAMNRYRSIWMIKLIFLSQYISLPHVIYVKLTDNCAYITECCIRLM